MARHHFTYEQPELGRIQWLASHLPYTQKMVARHALHIGLRVMLAAVPPDASGNYADMSEAQLADVLRRDMLPVLDLLQRQNNLPLGLGGAAPPPGVPATAPGREMPPITPPHQEDSAAPQNPPDLLDELLEMNCVIS